MQKSRINEGTKYPEGGYENGRGDELVAFWRRVYINIVKSCLTKFVRVFLYGRKYLKDRLKNLFNFI